MSFPFAAQWGRCWGEVLVRVFGSAFCPALSARPNASCALTSSTTGARDEYPDARAPTRSQKRGCPLSERWGPVPAYYFRTRGPMRVARACCGAPQARPRIHVSRRPTRTFSSVCTVPTPPRFCRPIPTPGTAPGKNAPSHRPNANSVAVTGSDHISSPGRKPWPPFRPSRNGASSCAPPVHDRPAPRQRAIHVRIRAQAPNPSHVREQQPTHTDSVYPTKLVHASLPSCSHAESRKGRWAHSLLDVSPNQGILGGRSSSYGKEGGTRSPMNTGRQSKIFWSGKTVQITALPSYKGAAVRFLNDWMLSTMIPAAWKR